MDKYYDREKLYKEVWEAPITEVSKRYGVSDVALSKTCKKLRVPKPPVGYWAKKAAGKAPPQPKLEPYEDAPRLYLRNTSTPKIPKPKLVPEAFAEAELIIEKVQEIRLSEDVEDLHPYVRNTRKVFKRKIKKGWKDEYNRISVSGEDVFHVSIGEDSLDRATVILDTICTVIVNLGAEVIQCKSGVCFRIMDENVVISISESSKKQALSEKDPNKYYYRDYEYVLTGALKLEIHSSMEERSTWSDGKKKLVEDSLVEVIRQIIRAAAWEQEIAAIRQQWEEKWRIEREKQAEIDRLARVERQRVAQLEEGFKKWRYHKELSEYVAAVKSHYIAENGEPEGDFALWIEWAEDYLEQSDPLKEGLSQVMIANLFNQ